jgi:ATP-dependent RNA helicase DOB1
MNSNDLFSFLDEAPTENGGDLENRGDDLMEMENTGIASRKRKSVPPTSSKSPGLENGGDIADNEPGPSVPKKPRIASPKPVVVDEFETEAKREVEASAGLTGSKVEAGSRLELRHQVRLYF